MAQSPREAFFPDLTPPQLDDLEHFWDQLIHVLYPNECKLEKCQDRNQVKQEQEEEIRKIIRASNYSILEYSNQLWEWIMMDDPDQMILKFIRAKKFKSNFDSLKMLINSLSFRIQRNLKLIKSENNSIANQLRIGKAFMFGFDKSGCPIFRINAAKHKSSDQTPKELEDFVLYSMEITRLFIVPPAQHVSLLVDLSGFGMSNMDWKCTNFMISTLEAHYPETLNFQIIHNAPWIFQGLWKAISTMLDPVVKSKVLFTSKDEDLLKMIDDKYLFKYEGGKSEFKWEIPTNYAINVKSSKDSANKTNSIDGNQESKPDKPEMNLSEEEGEKEMETRRKLILHLIHLTQLWLSLSSSDTSDQVHMTHILKLRGLVKMMLRAHYLKLMMYIQPKTIYHYGNILNLHEPGIIRWTNGTNARPEDEPLEAAGVQWARPNLTKLIKESLKELSSELDMSLNSIYSEISQLDY